MSGAFGSGTGAAVAAELGVPCLGAVPFDPLMVAEGDAGTPTVSARPESAAAVAFEGISRGVAEALGWRYVPGAEPAGAMG
jgi:ATP-binding protein involved in chromosome partitioning